MNGCPSQQDRRLCLSASPSSEPSQDPWYTAPEGYEDAAPGTILRVRPTSESLAAAAGTNASSVYNILYRTTDTFGDPSFAVTTLFVPSNPARDGRTRLLSYHVPYNTVNLDYSPSYTLETDFNATFVDIRPSLGLGWFVSVPDFEGHDTSLSVSVENGYVTLDSLRAVLRAGNGLEKERTRIALWGFSGGSTPSDFAAELLPYYAPEIKISGMAIGGVVYREVQAYLEANLKSSGPYNMTTFRSAAKMRTFEAYAAFANQTIGNYFVTGDDWLYAPELKQAIEYNWQMGSVSTPRTAIFVYKAIHDGVSPVEDTDRVVQRYCVEGANILYERNVVGGHEDEYINGNARAWAWLVSVLEGRYEETYNPVECTIRNVSVNTRNP
ncbi:secretory lipase-domain-containing protein [Aspergillus lucknowensis]|uniref:Secretory lipase-domain-containing protein n=1 Tax=Aspergillus lucknowensis TaxID=176173 RepID=A0ABR4LIQ5_9EURO